MYQSKVATSTSIALQNYNTVCIEIINRINAPPKGALVLNYKELYMKHTYFFNVTAVVKFMDIDVYESYHGTVRATAKTVLKVIKDTVKSKLSLAIKLPEDFDNRIFINCLNRI